MLVIIDTNILFNDNEFTNNSLSVFTKSAKAIGYQIIIPEVVIEELYHNYKIKIEEIVFSINDSIAKLNKLEFKKTKKVNNQKVILSNLNSYITNRDLFIKRNNIVVLPVPDINFKEIIQKNYLGKKPFKSKKESGYKDYLIWKSIISVLQKEQDSVVFITNNTNDFCESNLELHKDLEFELNEIKIEKNRLTIIQSLNEFNEKHVYPKLKNINELKDKFNQNKIDGIDVKDWIKEIVNIYIGLDDIIGIYLHLEEFLKQSSVMQKKLIKYEVLNVYYINATEIELKIRSTSIFEIKIGVDWNNMFDIEDITKSLGNEILNLFRGKRICIEEELTFEYSIFTLAEYEVNNFEMESIKGKRSTIKFLR